MTPLLKMKDLCRKAVCIETPTVYILTLFRYFGIYAVLF